MSALTATRDLPRTASLAQTLQNTVTMAGRGLLKIRRTPEQLIDVTVQPILFTLMFTYIFAAPSRETCRATCRSSFPASSCRPSSRPRSSGTQLREDMDKGVFDRFRSLPIARIAPLSGALLADTVRYAIATVLTFTMGFIMGLRPAGGIWAVVAAGLLVIACSWAISWIFAFFGVIARSASSVQGISMLILFPLTFLSNAFVPSNTMPSWLQWFVDVNPVSHLVTAVRDLVNTGTAGSDVIISLVGAAVIVAVFAPLTVRAYMRKA